MAEVGATREERREEAHFDLVVILFFFLTALSFSSAAEISLTSMLLFVPAIVHLHVFPPSGRTMLLCLLTCHEQWHQ